MTGTSDTSENNKPTGSSTQTVLHGNCIGLNGQGLLVLGASGSGKSGLSLELMALGADLVADDRVIVTRSATGLVAEAPAPIAGLIEARGIGLLRAQAPGPVPLACVLDLDRVETDRLPPMRQMTLLGQSVILLFKVDTPHFAAALIQFLKEGRQAEQ